jgi:hypothetical protein
MLALGELGASPQPASGTGASSSSAPSRPASASSRAVASVPATAATVGPDEPCKEFRMQLLELAFRTASCIPLNPHLRDRSRCQYSVVTACLELRQPAMALGYMEQIPDWRRGAAYADLALYCARLNRLGPVDDLIVKAQKIAQAAEDWRRDEIRVRIAHARELAGRGGELPDDLDDSQKGKLAAAARVNDAEFDEQVRKLDQYLASPQFDTVRNALLSAAAMHEVHYGNAGRRALLEARIRDNWRPMPLFIRADLLVRIARTAAANKDSAAALKIADEVDEMLQTGEWPLGFRLAASAALARVRGEAGDARGAASRLDTAWKAYTDGREDVTDVERVAMILPLAEAAFAIGEKSLAMAMYGQAVKDGSHNPNSRPRAIDLTAICVGLAVSGMEPDESLWKELRAMNQSLGSPW